MKSSTYIKYVTKKIILNDYLEGIIMSKKFKKRLNRDVELNNPILFNDKLQWLKDNNRDDRLATFADKFKVRNYVTEKIGASYLNELYGVYSTPEEINFKQLPKQYVLKANHASGFNIVVKNSSSLDLKRTKKSLSRWMKVDYSLGNKEWHYRAIEKKIICEKYIPELGREDVLDYRVFCFNGIPKLIVVDSCMEDKYKNKRDIYDLSWNKLNVRMGYDNSKIVHPKPDNLNELIQCSRELASDFPFVRVDFYIINGKIIFSELTFFHQSGTSLISPIDFEKTMGDWITLS